MSDSGRFYSSISLRCRQQKASRKRIVATAERSFFIALATLMLELGLVRVFDVILTPNMGYAIIIVAVFALGLGGIYLYIFPIDTEEKALAIMPKLSVGFCVTTLILNPTINWLPFDLKVGGSVLQQVFSWVGMYVVLVLPFLLRGY